MLRFFFSMKSVKLWRCRKWTEDDGNLVQHTCDHVQTHARTHTYTHRQTLKKTYTYLNDRKVIANLRWEMTGIEGRGGKQFTWKGISTLICWDCHTISLKPTNDCLKGVEDKPCERKHASGFKGWACSKGGRNLCNPIILSILSDLEKIWTRIKTNGSALKP